jgi:hypothetical protein
VNNTVFVGDYYSGLRHCRWVSWMADVSMKATRLSEFDCSRRRLVIVKSCRCRVWMRRLPRQENAIPPRLVDAALFAVQPKTSLSRCRARGGGAVMSFFDGLHRFRSPEILILQR